MLVLGRHLSEQIRIGDDIVITVVEIGLNNIHLGIDAPKDVPIMREEVYQKIKAGEPRRDNR